MMLLSGTDCIFSHCARIVLMEKGVECDFRFITGDQHPGGLEDINPYAETPTLVDRDLVLYDANLICEYLHDLLKQLIYIRMVRCYFLSMD